MDAQTQTQEERELGAVIRTNTVNLETKAFESVHYLQGSLVNTPEQPKKDSANISYDGSKWEITVESGRKNSSEVASQWISQTGGANYNFAPSGGSNPPPKELNFFFAVDVTTKMGNRARLYLGQGHYFDRNNWWIGGKDIVAFDNQAVLSVGSGSQRETYSLSGSVSTIRFDPR